MQEKLEALKTQLGNLSSAERETLGLGEVPQGQSGEVAEVDLNTQAGIGASMAEGLRPLMVTLGSLLEGVRDLTQHSTNREKRLKVEVKSAQEDSDEDEASLSVDDRLLRELTLGCVAANSTSKRRSIADMQLDQAVRRLNDSQRIRRKSEDSEYARLFNASLAEETVWMVLRGSELRLA